MQVLFQLHPVFMVLGVILIISAALIAKGRKKSWLNRHRLLAILGVISCIAGIKLMFIGKLVNGFPHFNTPHAILGLIALLLLIATPITGYLTIKNKKIGKSVLHPWLGRTTVLFALLALILGALRALLPYFKK